MHVCFKAKYCHKVFDDERVKERCEEIFRETAERYGMEIREMASTATTCTSRSTRVRTTPPQALQRR